MGALAAKFRMQPSEIDALDCDDFVGWLTEATRQNEVEKAAIDAAKAGNGD